MFYRKSYRQRAATNPNKKIDTLEKKQNGSEVLLYNFHLTLTNEDHKDNLLIYEEWQSSTYHTGEILEKLVSAEQIH